MNTRTTATYMSQFNRVVRILVWSGLGICIVAATAYDLRYWVFG